MSQKDLIVGKENFCQEIEELEQLTAKPEMETFHERALEILEKVQNEAFMKGYEYAIDILRGNIVIKQR